MKVYVAGLIDKSLRPINSKLQKKLVADCRKTLHAPSKSMSSQELNSFIVLSAEKKDKPKPKVIAELETGSLYNRFKKYYAENESMLRQQLKTDQELRETSKIVKDFVKEVEPNLVKIFDKQLKKLTKELPASYQEIQLKSYVAIWDFEENQQYRFFLSAFNPSVFTGSVAKNEVNAGELFDKLLMANFFATFLKPTIKRLKDMNNMLERLESGVTGTHYRTTDPKLQKKLELLFRILAAKLSALQDIDNSISRIFKLFRVPNQALKQYHFNNGSVELTKAIEEISSEIQYGESLLSEVSKKLTECQIHLRDYFDSQKNGIKTLDSMDTFKNALLPIAELSTDLFVEAELLKMWIDLLGADIPYFVYNTKLFSTNVDVGNVSKETIIAVRGLSKNYNLGSTTVYALRGVDLDIKEGEFVAIVGNSGAGKTTLLNCMAGLDSPDSGVVLFRGENLHKMSDPAKSKARLLEMGFIFQSYALLPHFNARENIALPADLAGLSKDLKERIENLLKGVGLSNQAKQYPATLSGGQMQRVAIARALTNKPAVIFADEPTGDLDSQTGRQVMDLLKKFHEETKTTIIVITHDKDVANYAERQILIEDGVIVPNKV